MIYLDNVGIIFRSSSTIKILAKTGPSRVPMDTPSTCTYVLLFRVSSCFIVKDKIDFEHNHDLIYHAKCPEPTCIDGYVGESARRITKRIKDHDGRNHTSQVWNYSLEKSHKNLNTIDFKIIDKNLHNNNKKKMENCLSIMDQRPKADVEHTREIYST